MVERLSTEPGTRASPTRGAPGPPAREQMYNGPERFAWCGRVAMRAWQVAAPRPVEERPLGAVELAEAPLGAHELRIRVQACGVCHTDLHIVEGDIPLPKL